MAGSDEMPKPQEPARLHDALDRFSYTAPSDILRRAESRR